MSKALLKFASKKVAKATVVSTETRTAEPVVAQETIVAPSSIIDTGAEPVKPAVEAEDEVVLTEEEELRKKRDQEAARAKFHQARSKEKAAEVAAPPPAPVAAPEDGSAPAAVTAPPVAAPAPAVDAGAPGPKLTWREKEALKKAAMVKEMTTGVAAPAPAVKFTAKVESDSEFPTLGSAPAAKAPVKAAGVWGSVAKVKAPLEAAPAAPVKSVWGAPPKSVVAAQAEIAAAAPPPAPAPAAPVSSLLVDFASLSLTGTVALEPAEYKTKVEEQIKNMFVTLSIDGLVKFLREAGGTSAQLTSVVIAIMLAGLDAEAPGRKFVDVALPDLLRAGVLGRDNVEFGVEEVLADYDSLLLDVPKATAYLTVMLRTVVDEEVVPVGVLPPAVASSLGYEVEGEEEEYDFDEEYDNEEDVRASHGLATKQKKGKDKHAKKDA